MLVVWRVIPEIKRKVLHRRRPQIKAARKFYISIVNDLTITIQILNGFTFSVALPQSFISLFVIVQV
jgi:hypothetical protein